MRRIRITRMLALALAAGLLATACGSGEPQGSVSPLPNAPSASGGSSSNPSRPPSIGLGGVQVGLEKVASLDSPLAMAPRLGDDALYVANQSGTIMAIRDGEVDGTPVLDVTGKISTGGERGLLGLAFSADGDMMYVNYTDTGGDTNVVEYRMTVDGNADPATARRVLFVRQPFANHNGGNLAVGPDGDLYIGLGDGGSGGDPFGNGQNLGTLLGKMLRIDPRRSGDAPYSVPADNPFAGRKGARPEIWAYGLRNPWRYTFDRDTGDLWIGDVGQDEVEEVDMQPSGSSGGQNYGWNPLEGTHPYSGDKAPPDAVPPVFEYSHGNGGCVVTGGYVYRGSAIPGLQGAYVFADFCIGEVMAFRLENGKAAGLTALGLHADSLSSFGEDQDGELYTLSLSGEVQKIVPG